MASTASTVATRPPARRVLRAPRVEPSRRPQQRAGCLAEVRASLLEWRAEMARQRRFCPKGHDKDVMGRTSQNKCRECALLTSAVINARKRAEKTPKEVV